MIRLIDRYFLKQPLIRRFLTRLLVGDREQQVKLLAQNYLLHTVREHGLFRASKLSETCSLFRDEIRVLLHLAGILRDGDTFHIGVFAATIAGFRAIYPNLSIYAFEPNPDT